MLKSISLAGKNWKVLIKAIVCQVVILALVIAVGFLLFGKFIEDAFAIVGESGARNFVSQTVAGIVNGTFDSKSFAQDLTEVIDNLQDSIAAIDNFWGSVELTYVSLILMFVMYRMLIAVTDVTVDCQLEEYMTSLSSRPFTWFFFKKQGRTWKFALLQFVFAFPLDILVVTGSIGFYLLFLIAFNWWTIIPVAVLLVILYSVRLSLFAFCLPSVACNETPVRKAFGEGISKVISRFCRVLWKTLVIVAIMVCLTLVSLIYIKNPVLSVAVSTVPNFILFFVLKCINIVEYFNATERPYFYKTVLVEGTEKYNKREAKRAKKQARKQAKQESKIAR